MKNEKELERRGGTGNEDWFSFRSFTERRAITSAAGQNQSRPSPSIPAEAFPFVNPPAESRKQEKERSDR